MSRCAASVVGLIGAGKCAWRRVSRCEPP